MTTSVKRAIVVIDESKCNGCGECISACHEGALQLVDGKARLVRDDYCDGLGACLGECPQGAITVEERDAVPFDEAAVEEHLKGTAAPAPAACPSVQAMLTALGAQEGPACGCPSAQARELAPAAVDAGEATAAPSALRNWPTQLKLVPVQAPYLAKADLLISADCVPFAYGGFHSQLLPGKVVLQACPKLDDVAFYRDKLAAMFAANEIRSVTVARMEVPCCGGLTAVVRDALEAAGSKAPLTVVTIGIDGDVLD
jgi:NAD-dependent dihydropyrimidine dehydrogenase PreA subunit